jgi:predicted nucleic acid-binding protein
MDVCCLCRPYDDISQERIYFEAEAVLSIISRCESGEWTLISSGIIDFELSKISDMDILEKVYTTYSVAKERFLLTPEAEQRATVLQQHGLKPFDSLHVALAEKCGADVFLTTDKRLLKKSNRIGVSIRVANPLFWFMEVTTDEW